MKTDTVEYPMTVRDAAKFLGVSLQTVYLWVERKQIPHLRVMGRNIRFLKSDLEPFRASSRQEVENGKTSKHDGVIYRATDASSGGCGIGTEREAPPRSQPAQKIGRRRRRNCGNGSRPGTTTSWRSSGRASTLTFSEWADLFLENYSKPPMRARRPTRPTSVR